MSKKYKVMCWDTIDSRFNFYDLTLEEAEKKLEEMERKFPNLTFQIFID